MANNSAGELRRSAVVSSFGPGAIVDFRIREAPVSAVTAGLEEWDRRSPPAGILNPQTVFEPRLQKKLGVAGFRLPPVNIDDDEDRPALIGVRFPAWLLCPGCHSIKMASKWNREPGDAARICGVCTAKAAADSKVFVVPVRFVCACEKGHLEEFPWDFWVQHKPRCARTRGLTLKSEAAGLAGLTLRCGECKATRSMEGVFSKKALAGLKCSGRRPWLAAPPEQCDQVPRTLQRGASNLYFPVTLSALDIPPWSDNVQKSLGQFWDPIVNTPKELRTLFIQSLSASLDIAITPSELAEIVEERLRILETPEALNLRWDEYLQFASNRASALGEESEFEIRPVAVPQALSPFFQHLVRAVRLREVRALSGFTRINPPNVGPDGLPTIQAHISVTPLKWLPAIEVRGEGIFIALNQESLTRWENRADVIARILRIHELFVQDWKQRFGEDSIPSRTITARFVLLHTLSHILMRQLALECGYSTASLRERLYVGDNPTDMAGLLIYTATPDADGTLGGLARQGQPSRMAALTVGALESMRWCSSDPLCIAGLMSAPESFSLAACHSCVLAPETSCEEYNRFLDRALLTGTPENPEIGYFQSLFSP